jgi:hypothetical protein
VWELVAAQDLLLEDPLRLGRDPVRQRGLLAALCRPLGADLAGLPPRASLTLTAFAVVVVMATTRRSDDHDCIESSGVGGRPEMHFEFKTRRIMG